MSRVLALHLKPHEATAVVVSSGGAQPVVEAATRVTLSPDDSPQRRGVLIAEALAPLKAGKLPTVVALPRDGLLWQNFQLPPAPDDELPQLVLMQAERDLPLEDEGAGFDFLPLEGDAESPRRVLGVGLARTAWQRTQETLVAAGLKVRQIVPEALGWPLLVERHGAPDDDGGVVHLGVAAEPGWAALWANADGAVRLLRSVRLPEDSDVDALSAVLAGELRRTRLALGQIHQSAGSADVYLAGDHPPRELADRLEATLGMPVIAVDARQAFVVQDVGDDVGDWAAVASLAAHAAAGHRPALDLLNPRRPPAQATNVRTYLLAAAAAVAAVGMLGWRGYRNVNEPLEAAAAADAERTVLVEMSDELAVDKQRAAAIERWQAAAGGFLPLLADVARSARPESLDAEEFPEGADVVVTRANLTGRVLTLDGAAKDAAALQPFESRLRARGYRVDRGTLNIEQSPVKGYSVAFSVTLRPVAEATP